MLKHYAPVSSKYGFHFLPYDKNIFTPVIRKEIRSLPVANNGHYTVYLPAYSDKKIIKLLSCFPEIKWEVFSKHSKECYQQDNICIRPVSNDEFIASMVTAEGVLCGAGFQTPSEVLYLKKKLMVVPMKGQYEQQCNGAALKVLGVPVIKNLKRKQFFKIKEWIEGDTMISLDFPDETEYILDEIIEKHYVGTQERCFPKGPITASKFRNLLLKKIFYQPGT